MAATRIGRAGNMTRARARQMATVPSSSGSPERPRGRRGGTRGSSSRNRHPWWARRPRRGGWDPRRRRGPRRSRCGAGRGTAEPRRGPASGESSPATEWIGGDLERFVVGHRRQDAVGSRRASMVLPLPGGPIMIEVVSPGGGDLEGAARPVLAADLGEIRRCSARALRRSRPWSLRPEGLLPRKCATTWPRCSAMRTSMPATLAASRALPWGTMARVTPLRHRAAQRGQDAAHGAHRAAQRELAEQATPVERPRRGSCPAPPARRSRWRGRTRRRSS